MIETPIVDGWRLVMYAEHNIAMFPPYVENSARTVTVECDRTGMVEVWGDEETAHRFVPLVVFRALFAAVAEWAAAQAKFHDAAPTPHPPTAVQPDPEEST